ncbi:MAG TPA: hypothetical protein VF653_02755 [Methylomirabilota bacterium]
MNHREHAVAIATLFEGRCTCASMDGGVDCPWCRVFHDILHGHPVTPPRPRSQPTPSLSLSDPGPD